jgi:hypothetical protein
LLKFLVKAGALILSILCYLFLAKAYISCGRYYIFDSFNFWIKDFALSDSEGRRSTWYWCSYAHDRQVCLVIWSFMFPNCFSRNFLMSLPILFPFGVHITFYSTLYLMLCLIIFSLFGIIGLGH